MFNNISTHMEFHIYHTRCSMHVLYMLYKDGTQTGTQLRLDTYNNKTLWWVTF